MLKEFLLAVICVIITSICFFFICRNVSKEEYTPGRIIIGYQGIGKSTLASRSSKYIDLESSCFKVNGRRHDDWFRAYCEQAYHIARQGYTVFTSSHDEVRQYFEQTYVSENVPVYTCFPAKRLQQEWIQKLHKRYMLTDSKKDLIAYKNAVEQYPNSIDKLMSSELPSIVITDTRYNLEKFLKTL